MAACISGPEVGIVEVLAEDSDTPVPEGTAGRLVCTGLLNQAMPLIRYEVGDRVALAPGSELCPCGRTMPIVKSIEGRNDDLIVTPDRRHVGRLDPVFKADLGIREAQIIQESSTRLHVHLVPTQRYSGLTTERMVRAVQERVGAMDVTVTCVPEIPRGANGKFQGVVSRVRNRERPPSR